MDDIVVIGAGPYGLSVASHLRGRGLSPRVFGQPMSFWERQMPRGMLVRSPWGASSISDPDGAHSLDAYVMATNDWPSSVKVVQLTWKTSCTLPNSQVNSENIQTARVVIRKQQDS